MISPGHISAPSTARKRFHRWVYLGGLGLLAAGLPSSVFLMSISQIILFLNWLAEGELLVKFRRFAANRAALVFVSIYLLHLAALFYSSNWDYGLSTLRTRLPIFLLTLVVASSDPLRMHQKRWILMAFSASISVVSLVSLHIFLSGDFVDYRELSPFVSHIRLSLMVALSVFALSYMARRGFADLPLWSHIAWAMALWHLVYLFMLHSLSGMAAFIIVGLVLLVRYRHSFNRRWRPWLATLAVLAVVLPAGLAWWLWQGLSHQEKVDPESLEEFTALGTPYLHLPDHPLRENGHLVYIYVAEEELRERWNRDGRPDYDGYNQRGEPVKHVLLRYMSSLGLRKDAGGFDQLSQGDLEAIEEGIANVHYTRWPWIITRLHQSMWEIQQYRLTGNPAGHSLAMRFSFWQAAWEAIKKKPLLGWGTGDIREASAYGLKQIESPMDFERWMKPHNQYLSLAVLFGIPAMLYILFAMVYPAARQGAFSYMPFVAFFTILLVSMLNEDTIDTQAGLSFFVFFYNYFVFLEEAPGPS